MKIRPGKNQVAIILTPHEAMKIAKELFAAALATNPDLMEAGRLDPPSDVEEAREG